jgi:Sec-independent protein translocase protein TatA
LQIRGIAARVKSYHLGPSMDRNIRIVRQLGTGLKPYHMILKEFKKKNKKERKKEREKEKRKKEKKEKEKEKERRNKELQPPSFYKGKH